MKSIIKKTAAIGAAAVLSVLGAQSAMAGGEVSSYPSIWQGAYVGAHLGGNFGEVDVKSNREDFKEDLDGAAGGFHLGYNWQRGKAVFGVETDISWTGAEFKRRGGTFSQDFLGSLRGRLGFTTGKTLIYATGGVAWVGTEGKRGGLTVSGTDTGYVVGGGLEHKISNKLSLRGEVLHYGFEDKDDDINVELDSTVVRAGVSYSFN